MLAASLGIPYPTPTLSFVLPVIFPIQDVLELVLETVRKIRSERGGAPLTEPWWHTPWLHCSRISARNLCSGAGSGLTKRKSVPRPSGAVILGSRVVGGSSSTRSPFPPVPTPRAALGDVAQPVRSSLTPARSTPCPCSCRCSPHRARHARVATTCCLVSCGGNNKATPSRSITEAACTLHFSTKPCVSTNTWRLRPLICLAPSYPRTPPTPVVFTL